MSFPHPLLPAILLFSLPALALGADDSFDGTLVDTLSWEWGAPGLSALAQDDALSLESDGTGDNPWCNAPDLEDFAPGVGVVSRWMLSGDFDVQVSFSDFEGPAVDYAQAFLTVYQDTDNALHMKRIRGASIDGFQTVYIHGSQARQGSSVSSDSASEGVMRIVRQGDIFTTWIDVGAGFQQQSTFSGLFSGDVNVALTLHGQDTAAVTFDDLVVNDGVEVDAPYGCDPQAHTFWLDIKPGSCPNRANLRSNGVLTATLFGSETLDVAEIDLTSLALEGVTPALVDYRDKGTPAACEGDCACCTDPTRDGFLDLSLKFRIRELAMAFGEVVDGDVLEPTLEAETLSGIPLTGTDLVLVVLPGI